MTKNESAYDFYKRLRRLSDPETLKKQEDSTRQGDKSNPKSEKSEKRQASRDESISPPDAKKSKSLSPMNLRTSGVEIINFNSKKSKSVSPKKRRNSSEGITSQKAAKNGTPEKKMKTESNKETSGPDQLNNQLKQKLSKGQRKRLKKKMKKLAEKAEKVEEKSSSEKRLHVSPKKVVDKKVKDKKHVSPAKEKVIQQVENAGDIEEESIEDDGSESMEEEISDGIEDIGSDDSTISNESVDAEPMNPHDEGQNIFQEMIYPTTVEDFFRNYWEKKVLYVKRNTPDYYQEWLSTGEIDEILREKRVMFGEHIDVTSYEDGTRSTLNPEGRAYPSVIWDFFRAGCSTRMLCPQAFSDQLAFNLNVLQEYFGCFVGANTYLTPPGTQGFAPHYDDIEAFILQIEGTKKWRIYNPRAPSEKLPRFSSGNFTQKEVGKPIMEVTLHAGDMLYFPRGMIHQAICPDDDYSFHLTVSTNQKNTWGDLLLKLLPMAVEKAMSEDVSFRRGLPPGFLRFMGTCVSTKEKESKKDRERMIAHAKKLTETLIEQYLPIDRACDEIGKQLANDSLPPILEDNEARHHVSQQGEQWSDSVRGVVNAVEISPDTELRLVRFYAMRCIQDEATKTKSAEEGEEGVANLYHCISNTRIYREVDPTFTAVSAEALPCIRRLIKVFPSFVRVEDFPVDGLDAKLSVAVSLYEMGLVVSRKHLSTFEDDPETESE